MLSSPKTIIWIVIAVYGLYMLFKDPFYGVLLYMFEFFTHPQYRYWGRVLPDINYPTVISVLLLISFCLKYRSVKESHGYDSKTGVSILLLFWLNIIFVYFFVAVNKVSTWNNISDFLEIIVLYYVFVKTVNDKKKLNLIFLMLILGNLHFSYEAWGKHLSGGRLEGIGGGGTRDANHLANDMLAVVPFLGAYFLSGTKYERLLALIAAPFLLNTLILCNSRGAYLGLIAAGLVFLYMADRKYWKKLIPTLLGGVALFLFLADANFYDRFSKISDHEDDNSATGRLAAWSGALRMLNDYPLGTGYKGFVELSPVYIPEVVAAQKAHRMNVHNTVLSSLTSWGFQGGALFIFFNCYVFYLLFKTRKYVTVLRDERLTLMTVAMMAGWTGFWVAAMFGVREKATLLYWLAATSVAMFNVYTGKVSSPGS